MTRFVFWPQLDSRSPGHKVTRLLAGHPPASLAFRESSSIYFTSLDVFWVGLITCALSISFIRCVVHVMVLGSWAGLMMEYCHPLAGQSAVWQEIPVANFPENWFFWGSCTPAMSTGKYKRYKNNLVPWRSIGGVHPACLSSSCLCNFFSSRGSSTSLDGFGIHCRFPLLSFPSFVLPILCCFLSFLVLSCQFHLVRPLETAAKRSVVSFSLFGVK